MPVRDRRSRPALLAAAVVALATTGCFLAPPEAPRGGPAAGPPTTAVPRPTASLDPEGTDTVQEFRTDINGARDIAEEYWTAQLNASGIRFEPVGELIPYARDGEVHCGEQPVPRNNAAYCPAGDFIAYDEKWAFEQFRRIGDAFLFYLLGHEYAHGIQVRLGIQAAFTIQQELQADCMAGAYIGDSVRGGRLILQDGDIEELRAGLRAVADAPGQPWFAEGSHGTAAQRTAAFANGYDRSLASCGLT